MAKVRLALAQTNPLVGNIDGNLADCLNVVIDAAKSGANMVLFGEMVATGYPIEDLATRKSFVAEAETAVHRLAADLLANNLGHVAVIIGHPSLIEDQSKAWAIAQNSASVLLGGKVIGRYAKHHLPNYSVFDEYRIFVPGKDLLTFEFEGIKFATLICEDIWQSGGPVAQLQTSNADVCLVLNGSPFEVDKTDKRAELVQNLAKSNNCAVAYVNLVGGQDDLVFDGDSIFVNAEGETIARAAQFASDVALVDIDSKTECRSANQASKEQLEGQVWSALVLGLRDYVSKNGFKSVVLGLSGGIDSAVCATIAADAIGAENVFGVSMPSRYSSDHSRSDADDLAERLGVHLRTEPIEAMVSAFETQLGFDGLAAENLQARMRGAILMGLSNAEGHLTLTTGNKTELAVGYSTIYGDSVGGFAPIKDVEKTLVWELAKWRNAQATDLGLVAPIPENSISKPPSAELRPDQTDQDSLPDYELLDDLLDAYIEKRLSREEIIAQGFDAATVDRIIHLVSISEWKRRQGAIGPKITGMAYGRDRRMPITNGYKR
ncbi:NAD+ synthase [Rhodoluna sp.]|uniref:NAD+ synthase n=1 Tax=Rhodoluna sp. TaxID=1969481 RepID=UPI0025E254DF|nr:NAD+ synthase [Rhodoluna sp.]